VKKNVSLQKNALVVVVAICGLLVVVIGYVAVLAPKQKAIGDLRKQTAAVRQQIADDLARAATARTATGAPTIKTADIYRLETAMPSLVDMPDLLLELDQTVKAAGVSLTSITPSPLADGVSGYSTEHLVMSVDGNFYTITDLLYRLRNFVYVRSGALQANGRIFTVDNVTLSPNGQLITAQITLDTYVYGTNSASPTGSAVPPTGTSTTTTTTSTTPAASGPSAAGATP
jgi:Tfp pilus assembly protein PilO